MKYFFLSFISLLVVHFSTAQEKFFNTDINDLELSLKEEERPVLLFFTADWCKYCQAMKSHVFTDSIVLHLSTSFYTVAFPNTHQKKVAFNGKVYSWVPTGVGEGYHEFVQTFAKKEGAINFPTLVLLWKGKRLLIVNQYLDKDETLELLRSVLTELEK